MVEVSVSSVFVKIGICLYCVIGIPVKIDNEASEQSKWHVRYWMVLFMAHIYNCLFFSVCCINSMLLGQTLAEMYYPFTTLAYTFETLVLSVIMLTNSRKLIWMHNIMETFQLKRTLNLPKRAIVMNIIKLVTFASLFFGVFNDIVFQCDAGLGIEGEPTGFKNATQISICIAILTSWITAYNFSLAYLLNLEFVQDMITKVSFQRNLQIFTIPLEDPVNDPFLIIPIVENLDSNMFSNVTSGKANLCRNVLYKLSKIKTFTLTLNHVYYLALLAQLFDDSAYLADLLFDECIVDRIIYRCFFSVVVVLSTAIPIFVNNWRLCISNNTCIKMTNEYYCTKNASTKKSLQRFIASSKDEYPNSPCLCFDIKPAILTLVQDSLILVITTVYFS